MEKFYDPRRDQENTPVKPGYNPSTNPGSSVVDTSDLHPERSYDVDTRRIVDTSPETLGRADTANAVQQRRVNKFIDAARTAGKFRQQALIDEPQLRGKTPRTEANIKGTNVPTLGDRIGLGGSTNYATKPHRMAGTFRGF